MPGYYEVHCHILPGVDDGAASMKETVQMLEAYHDDGVRTIYATSHYRRGMFEPSMKEVQSQFERVRRKASEIGRGITVHLGCEFHANMDMVEMLDDGRRPTMGGGRCVLTEFSHSSELPFIRERCYALLSHGYEPIIAHAERYQPLLKHLDAVEDLVQMGVWIQVNAGSILGQDGLGVKWFCRKLMKQNLVHLVGSDAHNMTDRKPQIGRCAEYIAKKMGRGYMEHILVENPQKIIEGR